MIDRKTPPIENKLLILLALRHLGPCTNLQILEFLAQQDWMDYFTLQFALLEMEEAKQVEKSPHALGDLYQATEEGQETLMLFIDKLPQSKVQAISTLAPHWQRKIAMEKHMLSNFSRRKDGNFALRLRLLEQNEALADLTLFLPTRDMADRFSRSWPHQAAAIYGKLMGDLGEDYTETAPIDTSKALPPNTYLLKAPGKSQTLLLEWSMENTPQIAVKLLLPTAFMCHYFANQWHIKGESLSKYIFSQLALGQ